MAYPRGSFTSFLQGVIPYLTEELESLYASAAAYLGQEHHQDGTHAAITADSLTTTGDAEVGGDLTVSGGELSLAHFGLVETSTLLTLQPIPIGDDPHTVFDYDTSTKTFRVRGAFTGDPTVPFNGVVESGAGFKERNRSTRVGEWATPTFAAGNFTASAGAWTVGSTDVTTYAYTLVGKTMTLAFDINSTDVTVGGVLRLDIPSTYTAAKEMWTTYLANDAGAGIVTATCRVLASGTYVELFATAAGGNFAATAGGNTSVHGQITFEVS